MEAVDSRRHVHEDPGSPKPPVSNRVEGVLLVPGAGRVLEDQVELTPPQVVELPVPGNDPEVDAVEVVHSPHVPLVVSPPVLHPLEGHRLASGHFRDDIGSHGDLELVVVPLYPALVQRHGVGGGRPQSGVVVEGTPARAGPDDAERIVVDLLHRLEVLLRVAVVEGVDDVLRPHHLQREDVVVRRHRLAVAEAGVRIEAKIDGPLVVLDRPVGRHARDEPVRHGMQGDEAEVHGERPVPAREGVVGIGPHEAEGQRIGVDEVVERPAPDRLGGADEGIVQIRLPDEVRRQPRPLLPALLPSLSPRLPVLYGLPDRPVGSEKKPSDTPEEEERADDGRDPDSGADSTHIGHIASGRRLRGSIPPRRPPG